MKWGARKSRVKVTPEFFQNRLIFNSEKSELILPNMRRNWENAVEVRIGVFLGGDRCLSTNHYMSPIFQFQMLPGDDFLILKKIGIQPPRHNPLKMGICA